MDVESMDATLWLALKLLDVMAMLVLDIVVVTFSAPYCWVLKVDKYILSMSTSPLMARRTCLFSRTSVLYIQSGPKPCFLQHALLELAAVRVLAWCTFAAPEGDPRPRHSLMVVKALIVKAGGVAALTAAIQRIVRRY